MLESDDSAFLQPPFEDGELAFSILESTPHCVFVLDSRFRLLFANGNFLRFTKSNFNLVPERGDRVIQLLPSKYAGAWRERFKEIVNGQCGRVEEVLFIKSEARCFDVCYQPLNVDGKTDRVVVFFEEITERRRQELKQKQTEKALHEVIATRETLLSVISHDLRSPIFQLNGLLFLIQQSVENRDEARIKMQAEDLEERIGHLTHTLDNILSWSNIRRSSFRPTLAEFSLASTVENAVGLLKPAAVRKGIKIHTEIPEGLILNSDREMVAFVIRNLINNAIKFSLKGGKVELTVRESDTGLEMVFQDYGVGMDPKRIQEMREEDSYFSEVGTWGESGTGLGLRLCIDFLQRLDGRLTVDSGKNKGTTVSVWVPNVKN
jgi:signal transduction histidine kinase